MLDLEMTSDTRAISKSFNSSTSSTSTVKLKTPPGDLTARLGLELSDTKQIPSRSPSPLPSAAKRNIFDTENKVRLLFQQNLTFTSFVQNIPQIVQWSRRLLKLLDQESCLSSNFNESPLEFIKAMQLVNVTDAANYASKICATLPLPQVL